MKKRYITLFSVLIGTVACMAQTTNDTINRMVLVESTYNPIITGAVKRNFIPEAAKPTMNKEQIIYADEGIDLTYFDRKANPAPTVAIMPKKSTPGYAHIGYGNYNNLSGLAAYKFRFNENGDLAIHTHIDGWNGNLKLSNGTEWRSQFYDMGLRADCNIRLGNATFNAGTHTARYSYNYLAASIPDDKEDTPQHADKIGVYISCKGAFKEDYRYQATIHYTHFGRSTYFAERVPHGENHFYGEMSFDMDFHDLGMGSVQVRSDMLTYQGLTNYSNYHSLEVTPRWNYRYEKLHLVGGFNMSFLTGKCIKTPLQISPECSISYVSGTQFTAKLTVDGGRDINTFSRLHTRSPYWASEEQLRPTYTFLNAHLGSDIRIMEGLHLHLGGGYKLMSDALFETAIDSAGITYTGITNHNAHVTTIDARISYNYKNRVNLSAKEAYYHWTLKGNRALLARTPKLESDINVRVCIMPNLHAYTNLRWITFTDTNEQSIVDWSLGTQYSLNKRLTLFLDAHNLLNHHHQYFTGYPSQGFNVLLGAICKF